jgi:hypothetical protein
LSNERSDAERQGEVDHVPFSDVHELWSLLVMVLS